MITWTLVAIPVVIALLTLPGTLELFALTLFGARAGRSRNVVTADAGPITFVIPAHDEADTIRACLESFSAQDAAGPIERVVIADNCTDDTASIARSCGARVIERRDTERRGKGHALHHAFEILLREGAEILVVIDADSRLEPGFVKALRRAFGRGEQAVQAAYLVGNAQRSRRTRLMNVALTAFNLVRPRARERMRVSAGILGNGFGLRRAVLQRVPYEARSIVEDLEYHVLLVRAGFRVAFVEDAVVRSDMPVGNVASTSQRARWEGGRYRMILHWVPRLLGDVLRGRLRSLEPLLELTLLPLAHFVLLLLLCLAFPFAPTRVYAIAGLCAVALHVLVATLGARGTWRDLLTLSSVPFYLLWKLTLTLRIARGATRNAHWIRTSREVSNS
ncbi:MAG: glycosyltransferase [Planctomycetes bacterium]|nr:glycosyltransferase [Planctomycetota bacterium]